MSDMNLWIRARTSVYEFGVDLVMMGESFDGRKSIVKDIVFEEVDNVRVEAPKSITINDAAAKRLMDDLWLAGVRPSKELYGSTDKDDIKNHLADMRSIVFNGITMNVGKVVDTKTEKK